MTGITIYTDNGFIMDRKHYIAIEHYNKLKKALEIAKEGLKEVDGNRYNCGKCDENTEIAQQTLTKINETMGE